MHVTHDCQNFTVNDGLHCNHSNEITLFPDEITTLPWQKV